MAKAKKLKSGSWRVQVFSHYEEKDGKKKAIYRSFTADTKSGAEMAALKFQQDRERYTKGRLTVSEAVEKYISARENVLSPATIREYVRIYDTRLGKLGPLMVADVTNVDLQDYVNTLSDTLSAKSVKNIYGLIISSISQYSDRIYRVRLPERVPPSYHVPTDAEVRLLLDNAGPELKKGIALAAFGTLRAGEICGLKYKDVLYDFSAVFVHSDMVRDKNRQWIHKDIPKNSSSIRRVELPAAVMEIIGTGEPDEYVYNASPVALGHAFIRLRNELGINCRFHDLRHYAASSLHAMGVPDQYIMERGGWATDSTLKSVYRNTLDDKSRAFNEKAVSYYAALLEGSGSDAVSDGIENNITRNITRKNQKAHG